MTSFDPAEFVKQANAISVTDRRTARDDRLRFSDLMYTQRLSLVVANTRDLGLFVEADTFNDLVNGRKSIQEVCRCLEHLHSQKLH